MRAWRTALAKHQLLRLVRPRGRSDGLRWLRAYSRRNLDSGVSAAPGESALPLWPSPGSPLSRLIMKEENIEYYIYLGLQKYLSIAFTCLRRQLRIPKSGFDSHLEEIPRCASGRTCRSAWPEPVYERDSPTTWAPEELRALAIGPPLGCPLGQWPLPWPPNRSGKKWISLSSPR